MELSARIAPITTTALAVTFHVDAVKTMTYVTKGMVPALMSVRVTGMGRGVTFALITTTVLTVELHVDAVKTMACATKGLVDVMMGVRFTGRDRGATYAKTDFTMQPVLLNVVTVSEKKFVKNTMGLASMAAVKTSNPLFVKNVFPINMAKTVDLIVDIAQMVNRVPQKTEFAPKVAILDGSVFFV